MNSLPPRRRLWGLAIWLAAASLAVALLAPPAFAHGKKLPAKKLVEQAIALLRTQPNQVQAIEDKLHDALEAKDARRYATGGPSYLHANARRAGPAAGPARTGPGGRGAGTARHGRAGPARDRRPAGAAWGPCGVEGALMTTTAPGTPGRVTRRGRLLDALDERLGLKGLAYPVPEHANKLAYSLGGLSLITFLLLVGTGIVLAQFYDPDPAAAHASVRRLVTDVTLGGWLRAFHYWAAMAMVVLVGLHLLRVFASGAFKRPREGNWLLGVLLAGMVAAFFFSGTVLKWDQEALEALQHNIEALPAAFFLAVTVHLLLVKRHGMARSPFRHGPEPEPTEPFTRHLARLGGFGLVLVAVLTVLAVLAPPGHGPAAVEGIEVTKPPWPLLWLYPLENWVGVSGMLWATLAVFAALLAVPFVDRSPQRHPRRRLVVVIATALVVAAVVALIVYGALTPVTTHLEG